LSIDSIVRTVLDAPLVGSDALAFAASLSVPDAGGGEPTIDEPLPPEHAASKMAANRIPAPAVSRRTYEIGWLFKAPSRRSVRTYYATTVAIAAVLDQGLTSYRFSARGLSRTCGRMFAVGARVEVVGDFSNGVQINAGLVRILAESEPPAPTAPVQPPQFSVEMRIQSVDKDRAPAVSEVKSGVRFYEYAYVTIPRAHGETYFATFSVQFAGEAPQVVFQDAQKVPVVVGETSVLSFRTGSRATLPDRGGSKHLTVIAQISSEGVTQTRRTSFDLVR
jgi:hypothetical protein